MDQITLDAPGVAVLAEGATASDVSNARGHLFELFFARLLAVLGYSGPRREHLNVTNDGIEIDVTARHLVTKQRLMAECKAYTANVRVPALTSFLGKYLLAREDDPTLAGVFVALPRLTKDATEQAEAAKLKFAGFQTLTSQDVFDLLVTADLLPSVSNGPKLHSDLTVVITEHGLALSARELDRDTRRAVRVVLWRKGGSVPEPLVDLVKKHMAEGLPVAQVDQPGTLEATHAMPVSSLVVPVRGSSSDFEYQFPAGPDFFVGRKDVARSLATLIRGRTKAGTVVVNAKSGWGKSSLALRLGRDVSNAGGVSLIVDTRTADRRDFVAAAMEELLREANQRKLLKLPEDAAYGSLASTIASLQKAEWPARTRPLLIVFDQFENVFRDESLTREFRDLAVFVQEVNAPITVGFAWKTDLVGWTEDYPYRLRDEIRSTADVVTLEPFGPREVETLLRRLEKAVGGKLDRELRLRLRELSQGLPWLFKKLASHIIAEVQRGVTQEQLVRESLNVQALFESDLAELSPAEQEGLHTIARSAPSLVSELEEAVPAAILQSLLNRRLVVQVGERIDTYWDTFRDFLVTGRVAIEDSYMIRYAPTSGVAKLLRMALAEGGSVSVPDAADILATSPNVIWNFARELRQLGLIASEQNRIVVSADLVEADDRETAVRNQVAAGLRRHKIMSVVTRLLGDDEGAVSLTRLAAELPVAFPAVEANQESWLTYARAFAQWLSYAGLVHFSRDGITRQNGEVSAVRLLSGAVPVRVRSAFPHGPAGPAEQLLQHLANPATPRPNSRSFGPALRDLALLGVVELDERERVTLTKTELIEEGAVGAEALRPLVELMPGASEALQLLTEDSAASPANIGAILREAHGAGWVESTTHSVGKHFRSWARLCGVRTAMRGTTSSDTPNEQLQVEWDIDVVG